MSDNADDEQAQGEALPAYGAVPHEEPIKRRRRMTPENLEKLKFARECAARKKLELSVLQNKAKELKLQKYEAKKKMAVDEIAREKAENEKINKLNSKREAKKQTPPPSDSDTEEEVIEVVKKPKKKKKIIKKVIQLSSSSDSDSEYDDAEMKKMFREKYRQKYKQKYNSNLVREHAGSLIQKQAMKGLREISVSSVFPDY